MEMQLHPSLRFGNVGTASITMHPASSNMSASFVLYFFHQRFGLGSRRRVGVTLDDRRKLLASRIILAGADIVFGQAQRRGGLFGRIVGSACIAFGSTRGGGPRLRG